MVCFYPSHSFSWYWLLVWYSQCLSLLWLVSPWARTHRGFTTGSDFLLHFYFPHIGSLRDGNMWSLIYLVMGDGRSRYCWLGGMQKSWAKFAKTGGRPWGIPTGTVINFVFVHNMLNRCMYANHKETGPQGQRDLSAILKEMIGQFVTTTKKAASRKSSPGLSL